MNSLSTKKVAKNIMMSITSQIISLVTSFVLGFIVPKFISEYNYAYWQIYVLYASYVGILHFGLLDGIILRYSKYNFQELDKNLLASQFKFLLFITSLFSIIGIIFSVLIFSEVSLIIGVLVCFSIISKNIFTYNSYIFQITNRISNYSIIIIFQRAIYALCVCILLLTNTKEFYWYCLADIFADLIGFIIGTFMNKGLYFSGKIKFKIFFKEIQNNITAGSILMIANFAASFIIGGTKMIVQWKWDTLTFGQLSFSFSITALFLTFISSIGIVIYPSLMRISYQKLISIYSTIRCISSLCLFIILLFYFPLAFILQIWLPSYSKSIFYLGLLLPMIVFSSKVTLLTNNYLKVFREEKKLLFINVSSVFISFMFALISAFIFENIVLVVISVVFASIFKSIFSEIIVTKKIGNVVCLDFIIEISLSIIFMISTFYFDIFTGFCFYFIFLFMYIIFNRKILLSVFINK